MEPKQVDVDKLIAQLEDPRDLARQRIKQWRAARERSIGTFPIAVHTDSGATVLDVDAAMVKADPGYLIGKR